VLTRVIEGSLVLILAGVAALSALWWTQRSLIYFPSPGLVPSAARLAIGAEDVVIETRDGLRLGAWFVPASGPKSAPAVLVCNGNAGDRSARLPLAEALSRAGFSVLLFDYRGYGGNAGSPTEIGLLEDARAAVAHLETRPDVDPTRIAYFGESLGAGVATALAVERPPLALILRSPFTSLAALGGHHYPWLPVRPFIRDRYPIDEQIAAVRAPVLVIAGERDTIVPAQFSRTVYSLASAPKRLVVIADADHNDMELLAGDRMLDAMTMFLADTRRPAPP
jgi:hypothetical protein